MEIKCPSCNNLIRVSEEHYNQEVLCSYCNQSLFLEEQSDNKDKDASFRDAVGEIFGSNNFDDLLCKLPSNSPDYVEQIKQINDSEQAKKEIQIKVKRFKELFREKMIQKSILSESTLNDLINDPNFNELIVDQLRTIYPELFEKSGQNRKMCAAPASRSFYTYTYVLMYMDLRSLFNFIY